MSEATLAGSNLRVPLLATGVLVGLIVLLVATSGKPTQSPQNPTIVAARDLRFVDGPEGSVIVLDAASGATVRILERGHDGFVRATMRGLARDRRNREIGSDVPFHLSTRSGGEVVLEDPATGRLVNLEAFGRTNAATFASFLQDTQP